MIALVMDNSIVTMWFNKKLYYNRPNENYIANLQKMFMLKFYYLNIFECSCIEFIILNHLVYFVLNKYAVVL